MFRTEDQLKSAQIGSKLVSQVGNNNLYGNLLIVFIATFAENKTRSITSIAISGLTAELCSM